MSGNSGGEQVLAAFFTNLLTKNKPGVARQPRSGSLQMDLGRSVPDYQEK